MLKKWPSLVVSFKKTVDAMAVEEYCLKNNIAGRLIPLPKEISSGCGLAWKCELNNKPIMVRILKEINIAYDKMTEIMI